MLKLSSRNMSSTWQTQSTLLKEWVWTIHLAIELPFQKTLAKSFTIHMHSPNDVVCEIMQHLQKDIVDCQKLICLEHILKMSFKIKKKKQLEITRLCKRLILNSYSQNVHWGRAWSSRFDPLFLFRCVDLEYALRDHNW